jgi:iron complex transport system substrate-binding protein
MNSTKINNVKICSLLPSATEIIYALGLEDHLVAVTHECDYPWEALAKQRVTGSEISPALSSAEIDVRVRQQLDTAGTLYQLDAALLDTLAPDIIFTQQLCTVCAVSYENVARIAHSLGSKPHVVNLEPKSLEDIFQNILEVGRLSGVSERSNELVLLLRKRMERVQLLTRDKVRRKILFLEWIDPPFCAGHWIPELIELAGGYDPFGRTHQPSGQLAWEQILSYNPDTIIVSCCGFSVERTLKELHLLQKVGSITAVQQGNIIVVDGSSYFSRPGPRIVDSLEILATVLHPELFPFDYPKEIVHYLNSLETV